MLAQRGLLISAKEPEIWFEFDLHSAHGMKQIQTPGNMIKKETPYPIRDPEVPHYYLYHAARIVSSEPNVSSIIRERSKKGISHREIRKLR